MFISLVLLLNMFLKKLKNLLGTKKNINANIFQVQSNNSIMCGYFCIGFIDFMRAGKTLVDFTSLFFPYDFEKNDNIILNYFKDEWNWQNKFNWSNKIQTKAKKKVKKSKKKVYVKNDIMIFVIKHSKGKKKQKRQKKHRWI